MPALHRRLLWILAIAAGVTVANLYYNQPLLAAMARTLNVPQQRMGWVAMLTQVGYASGMLLFVPLADLLQPRRLVLGLLLAVTIALLGVALAPTAGWLMLASFLVGLTTVTPQVLIPFTARLARPEDRGRAVGILMGGLLLGILLARTVSGVIGEHLGWRTMFCIAAGASVVMAIVLARLLPSVPPMSTVSYRELMRSLLTLTRAQPRLREACVIGAMLFGAFSAFWATLVFLLGTPPYHYGSAAAGLFGIVGAVGAGAAPLAGHLADRRGPRYMIGRATVLTLGSFAVFWLLGLHLWGLIVGVILMDFGVQAAQVSNQARIFSLVPEAQGRVNTVYMISYFAGGSVGSLAGVQAWARWGWAGVCATGAGMTLVAWVVHLSQAQRASSAPSAATRNASPVPDPT